MAIKYRVRRFDDAQKMQDTHNKFSAEGFHPATVLNISQGAEGLDALVTYIKDDRLDQIEEELNRQKAAAEQMEKVASQLQFDDGPGLIT